MNNSTYYPRQKTLLAKSIATILLLGVTGSGTVAANEWTEVGGFLPYTQSDFGGVGLLQTPTARMNAEGHFAAAYSDTNEFRRLSMNLQLFDWFEATARYTDVRYRLYSPEEDFSGDQTLKDKGFDFKFRLLEETKYMPNVALGLRDVGGTGQSSSEYLVANKAFYTRNFGHFDVSFGVATGNLGTSDNIPNLLCEIRDTFCERSRGASGTGGQFEVDQWFRGPASAFGGVLWQTPYDALSLKLEYDSNNYTRETDGVRTPGYEDFEFVQDSPWNIGAEYRLNEYVTVRAGYERGNTFSFGFEFAYNLATAAQGKFETPKRVGSYNQPQQISQVEFERMSRDLLNEAGFRVEKIYQPNDATVTVVAQQERFRDINQAADRASRILASNLPTSVTRFELSEVRQDFRIEQINVNADQFRAAWRGERFYRDELDAITVGQVRMQREHDNLLYQADPVKGFDWSVSPALSQSFGGAETFFIYQVSVAGNAAYRFNKNWTIDGTMHVDIINNYDRFNFLLDELGSPLPRVRTRAREYSVNSDVWLSDLQVTYTEQMARDWYASAYGGYLERMFGGVGGELLYRPLNSTWAFGFDINYVKQRDPYSSLGFDNYDVFTGHATLYWKLPYLKDSMLQLKAGRFLAGDDGINVDFSHRFESGVVAGAYAAFTNVSAEDFGEGSFNKGVYLSIPFDLFFLTNSREYGTIGWQPITRDGGQLLRRKTQLYNMTSPR
ncbi:YjbH domain-containing protein [Pseudidiomarina aestuarii]|uniref:YjbH domain-containing protein n=1 Tax=Pseudidiomarina aestuarii TaxID=624146 RepID=A0A6N4DG03_9GAMM|nr:YjbH domain-containing protein [Pseudidiomarina aestuarii]